LNLKNSEIAIKMD